MGVTKILSETILMNFFLNFTVSYTTCTFKASVYFSRFLLSNSIAIVILIQLCEFECLGQWDGKDWDAMRRTVG